MLSQLRSFLRHTRLRRNFEHEMAEELQHHLASHIEDLVSNGVPRAEAERQARLAFGPMPTIQEECRESKSLQLFDHLWRDLRYAARVLRKSPTFTATAVLTLALVLGANTAIFSVVDSLLLRPLPYPEPDRLAGVVKHVRVAENEGDDAAQDGRMWETLHDHASTIQAAVYSELTNGINLVSGDRAEWVRQQRISTGFFSVLGIAPLIGREFTADEDRAGGPKAVLLTYDLWHRLFNDDTSIVGRTITLRGELYTVVGVMPRGARTNINADLWTTLQPSTKGEGEGDNYQILARLRPGVTWVQADSQVASITADLWRHVKLGPGESIRGRLIPLQQSWAIDSRKPLLVLWGAVLAVLLIGCVNIASLQLARSAARTREVAARLALGSSRGAIFRQLLMESLLIATLGGLLGIALGALGLKAFWELARTTLGLWRTVDMDLRLFAVSLIIALGGSLLFGVLPALMVSRLDVRAALGDGGRSATGRASHRSRSLLVVSEVALGMLLLISAGLLVRTFLHLQSLRPGFDSHNVLTGQVSLQDARYASTQQVSTLFDRSLARLLEWPGVESAAVALSLPYERALNLGMREASTNKMIVTSLTYVTPEYFRTLRIPLEQGRAFAGLDTAESAPVIIVNQAFARKYLPQQPLGAHLKLQKRDCEVIGVVGDIQVKADFAGLGPLSNLPMAYVPATQIDGRSLSFIHVWFSPSWIVRMQGSPESAITGLQRAVQSVDPLLPFAGFRTMDEVRGESLARQRFPAVVLGVLSGLAMLLAAIGIYGLVAQSVIERNRELGIRMAMGATVSQVISGVASSGLKLAAAGLVLGIGLAFAAGRVWQHLLWGVKPSDPLTFATAAIGLLIIAGLASILPALRVLRLDPIQTLRHE